MVPEFSDFQSRAFDLFLNARWHREGGGVTAKRPPIDSSRKRTCIEPLGYLDAESAHFAPIDFAHDVPSEHPFALLNSTCEWFPIVLMFMKLFTPEVLMR